MNLSRNATRIVALALASAALAAPGSARAACDGGQGGLICGDGAPRITAPAGLQVSRGGTFERAASGTVLRGGDRVLTGDAAASLSLGASCSAPVGAGALVSISQRGGRTCASVTNPYGPTVTGAIDQPTTDVSPALIIGAGGAAGAAALTLGFALADGGGNNAVPPIVPTVSAR